MLSSANQTAQRHSPYQLLSSLSSVPTLAYEQLPHCPRVLFRDLELERHRGGAKKWDGTKTAHIWLTKLPEGIGNCIVQKSADEKTFFPRSFLKIPNSYTIFHQISVLQIQYHRIADLIFT